MRFVSCIFLFLITFLNAEIIQIKNIDQCKEQIKPGMLVVFDIDNTLIEPAQSLGSDQWFSYRVEENIRRGMSKQESFSVALTEWISIQHKTKVKLVETSTVRLFEQLHNGGWQVIALTTRGIELAAKTIEQLKSVGIDFGKTMPVSQEVIFEHVRGALYREGIVFCDGFNKGALLLQFFKQSGLEPKKILFVDDKEKCLRDVEQVCAEHQISFIGLRYGFLDEKVKNLKPEVADEQWECFGNLISDEEANERLKNN